jgi:hypothetical protein
VNRILSFKNTCLIPPIGFVLYFVLFLIAASLYSGGHVADVDFVGFSWLHNYWCDLSSTLAINGQINEGRQYAIVAMVIACLCLALFYYLFSMHFHLSKFWKLVIPAFGLPSSICAILIFTPFHNSMLLLALVLGLFPVIGITHHIFKGDLIPFKKSGRLLLLLIAANIFIYYTRIGLISLPLLQKFTFLIALGYVGILCLKMRTDWSDSLKENSK